MKNSIDNIEKLLTSKYTSLAEAERNLQAEIQKLEQRPASECTTDELAKKRSQLAEIQKKLAYEDTKQQLTEARLQVQLEKQQEKETIEKIENILFGIFEQTLSSKNRQYSYSHFFEQMTKKEHIDRHVQFLKSEYKINLSDNKLSMIYLQTLAKYKKLYAGELETEKRQIKNQKQRQRNRTINAVALCGFITAIDKWVNARPRRR